MATSDKYDRQLRLWGAQGQRALGETCVVLIGTSAAGTETLKNLVLPGIGSICIVDSNAASNGDYASNFFQTQRPSTATTSVMIPRAQHVLELLQELNPDVQGQFETVEDWLDFDYSALLQGLQAKSKHVLIVGSDLEPPIVLRLLSALEQPSLVNIPLLLVQSYGLLGTVRVHCTSAVPILDPKFRDTVPDLRLVQPFDTLSQLADSIQWESLENHQHAHIPYPLILLKIAKEWKASHNQQLPSTFAEKQDFQKAIKAMARNCDMELNFQEAHTNAYLAYSQRELDTTHFEEILPKVKLHAQRLAQTKGTSVSTDDKPDCRVLYSLLLALDRFLNKKSSSSSSSVRPPPLHGTIPDMTSSTDLYVQLQTMYKEQAERDVQELRSLLPTDAYCDPTCISDAVLQTFCQNVYHVDVFLTRSISDEYDLTTPIPSTIVEDLVMSTMEDDERPEQLPMLWYLGLAACRLFYKDHGRYPGTLFSSGDKKTYEQDVSKLQACLVKIVHHYELQDVELIQSTLLASECQYAQELVRYGNAEVHNIASIVGGVGSQEAVKLITGQYVPINHTYVYNGIASIGGVYQF